MIEIWALIIGLAVQGIFFAGVFMTTIRSHGKRIDNLEVHNNLQDTQIAETHTISQVILTKLEYIESKVDQIAAQKSVQPN